MNQLFFSLKHFSKLLHSFRFASRERLAHHQPRLSCPLDIDVQQSVPSDTRMNFTDVHVDNRENTRP